MKKTTVSKRAARPATAAAATSRQLIYVLSTHWDREWYQPLMVYRDRLVQLMDRVLDGWNNGTLQGPFQSDGQSIVLEDYVEIRRSRADEVRRRVAAGQIKAGPWYVMPDEFLVSGESLVRNLRLGREVVREWGGVPSDAGYVCDIFGHNSQLPQIFAGFCIFGAYIWRGVNDMQHRLFWWEAADGTCLPTYKFQYNGYCCYAAKVRHAGDHAFVPTAETVKNDLLAFAKEEADATVAGPVLFFDGGDHLEWNPAVYGHMQAAVAAGMPGFTFHHGTLDEHLEQLLPQFDRVTEVLRGELRDPGRWDDKTDQQWLIPGVLSSRVWIKQWNADCQNLLCHWAEPFNALAQTGLGGDDRADFLREAWKWLIQNHPHDSICGCSIDRVHEDMKYRFSQSQTIGERVTQTALRRLAAAVTGEIKDNEVALAVFNPLPRDLDETVEVTVDLPPDWPQFADSFLFESRHAFRVFAADGTEIPYQLLSQTPSRTRCREYPMNFPQSIQVREVRISLPLRIPALGGVTLAIRREAPGLPVRHLMTPGLATSERAMANGILALAIADNGTLTITELRTKAVYERCLTFEDTADIGDGWYHGRAVNDTTFVSSACASEISLVANGNHLATFRIRTQMTVPAEFDFTAMRRREERATLVMDSLVSLRPGADRVEITTTVTNPAKDHRLRVLFPSGATTAKTYLADAPFDVIERPIALRADNHLYREPEIETKPQQSWTAVFGKGRGLAVISTGLLETAVRDLPERSLALTLFRGTRRTVLTDGEPEGQLNTMPLTFRYWLVPLTGAPDRRQLAEYGIQVGAGLRDLCLQATDLRLLRAELPAAPNAPALAAGLFRLGGGAVLTSARQVAGGLEVRVFNPATIATVMTLIPGPALLRPGATWRPVDLESRPAGTGGRLTAKGIKVTVDPKKIVTLQLT